MIYNRLIKYLASSKECPSPAEWAELLHGRLPAGRIEAMEAHFDGCPVCPAVVRALDPALPRRVVAMIGDAVGNGFTDPSPRWPPPGPATSSSPEEDEAGVAEDGPPPFKRAGDYTIGAELGRGGMGVVYRATDVRLGIDVALKVPSRRARRSALGVDRLRKEAKRLAALNHPDIVRIFAAGEQDGIPYFAMELIDGRPLDATKAGVRFPPREAAKIVATVARALEYAHGKGIFHLDLKPGNVFLTREGKPKVGDFGLARALGDLTDDRRPAGFGSDVYMAPEQWVADPAPLAHRTDVYGLGAILYELVTGSPPFARHQDRDEVRRRVLFVEPDAPQALSGYFQRDLRNICARCLKKAPEARYATAGEVAQALERFSVGRPPAGASWPSRAAHALRRQPRAVAASLVTALCLTSSLGALGAVLWQRRIELAQVEFDQGRALAREGRLDEGLARMRKAVDSLPYGDTLWHGHFSRRVGALEATTPRPVRTYSHQAEFTAAAVSPDGRYVILGDSAGATVLWEPDTGSTRTLSGGRAAPVTAVAFNKSGSFCMSGGRALTTTVWDVLSGERLSECRPDTYATSVAFLDDGDRFVTGTAALGGQRIQIWEAATGHAKRVGPSFNEVHAPKRLISSPDGGQFISISLTGECTLWDAAGGASIGNLSRLAGHKVDAAAFSADGKRIALVGTQLTVWETDRRQLSRMEAGRWQKALAVGFREDGGVTLVLETGHAALARRLSAEPGIWSDVQAERSDSLAWVGSVAGREGLLCGLKTKTIRLCVLPPLDLRHVALGAGEVSGRASVSADGSRVVTLARPKLTADHPSLLENRRMTGAEIADLHRTRLRVWDGRTLRPLSQEVDPAAGLVAECVAMSPTADKIAVGCTASDARGGAASVLIGALSGDGSIRFREIGVHLTNINAVAFSPDGKRFLTGTVSRGDEQAAELAYWDISGMCVWRTPYPASVRSVAFSPDGARAVVGGSVNGRDGVIRVHSLNPSVSFSGPYELGTNVTSAVFSHDGNRVAAADMSGRVLIFRPAGAGLELVTELRHSGGWANALSFGPGDDVLYAGVLGQDGGVHAWDARVWRAIDLVVPVQGGVTSFGMIPDDLAVIAVDTTGRMARRTVPTLGPD